MIASRTVEVAATAPAFPYSGPEELRLPIRNALSRVVDPEVAMTIVDVGLVYGVQVDDKQVQVRVTMTSAACPVAGLIMDDIVRELEAALGTDTQVHVELCWEPPWAPELMSPRARRALGA